MHLFRHALHRTPVRHFTRPGFSIANALLVGVRSVNPKSPAWNGWDGSAIAQGVTSNINMMTRLFQQLHRSPLDRIHIQTMMEPQDITKTRILNQLSNYSYSSSPGDLFIFYFSGHGGYSNGHGSLACYDNAIWDFDLKKVWKQFKPGVRIVMMADSCQSGNTNAILDKLFLKTSSNMNILSHDPDRTNINAMLIYYSPVDESRNTYSTDEGGFFTKSIINVMNQGRYRGNYKSLYEDIKAETARLTAGQTYNGQPIVLNPQYDLLGPKETVAFQKFQEQNPFTVGFPRELLPNVAVVEEDDVSRLKPK